MSTLTLKNVIIGDGIPKIIVPLVGKTDVELMEEAEFVKSLEPDMVEWRVDLYEKVEDLKAVENMIESLRGILVEELLLFTFRTHKEGGDKIISDDYYKELNEMASVSTNIDLLDVELFSDEDSMKGILATAKANGVAVIMSNHDFQKTPAKDEILERLLKMQELGADILKIAVMPENENDVLTLLDATYEMKTTYAKRPLITMSMGGSGVITRLAGELFGSACTFAAGKEASAPGQIPVNELREVLTILHKRK